MDHLKPLGKIDDLFWMQRALELAERGRGAVSPNPLVGAVLVRDGRKVAEGFHARFGGPHAEASALERAGARAKGATLYVTLEPCVHWGKTPPCVEGILSAGLRRVVVATPDPNPEVAGRGIERLRKAGIRVDVGVLDGEAGRQNAPYRAWRLRNRPFVTLKWAETSDGFIAGPGGRTLRITGPEALREAHRLRAKADAVLVGIGTALADDPLLTVRLAAQRRNAAVIRQPVRIVLDSRGRLPLSSRLVRTARKSPVWVVASSWAPLARLRALSAAGCEVIVVAAQKGRVPLDRLCPLLAVRQIQHLLVEGGAEVLAAFARERLADRIVSWISGRMSGEGVSAPALLNTLSLRAPRLRCSVATAMDGPDLRIEADLQH